MGKPEVNTSKSTDQGESDWLSPMRQRTSSVRKEIELSNLYWESKISKEKEDRRILKDLKSKLLKERSKILMMKQKGLEEYPIV